MSVESGHTLGEYRVERELGRGGMGVVFLAYDPTLERRVAIKVLGTLGQSAGSPDRLLIEVRNVFCAEPGGRLHVRGQQ